MLGEVRCSERFSIRFSRFQTESKKRWRTKDGVSCGFFCRHWQYNTSTVWELLTPCSCFSILLKDWKTIARTMVLWSKQIASTAQRHKLLDMRFQRHSAYFSNSPMKLIQKPRFSSYRFKFRFTCGRLTQHGDKLLRIQRIVPFREQHHWL